MKTFKVYHVKDDKLAFGFGERPKFPEDYEEVAMVRVPELGEVFRVTNHIDHAWWENEEVIAFRDDMLRSTSVDDVVLDDRGGFWRVEPIGWTKIGFEHPCNHGRIVLL